MIVIDYNLQPYDDIFKIKLVMSFFYNEQNDR